MWRCPMCHLALEDKQGGFVCDSGHRFDRAKEGYVNLHLVQHKRSKQPGDNKEMINARRAFLQQGYYRPLVDGIADMLDRYLPQQPVNLFDAGCGEGYYLAQLHQHLSQQGRLAASAGCDVAKVAIQKAAKQYADCQFAVASSYQLPLLDDSQQAILQVFAPGEAAEFARVLAGDGVWLQVNPTGHHLQQIKQAVYQQPRDFSPKQDSYPGFSLIEERVVQFEFDLSQREHRQNLLMMTPFYWPALHHNKLEATLDNMAKISACFQLRLFRKQAADL